MPQFPQLQPIFKKTRTFLPTGLDSEQKSVFKQHILSAILGAISVGVIYNHEYIAVNGLEASIWQITALTMIWPISNFLSVFINHWIERRGCYSKAVTFSGILLRLPIVLMSLSSNVNVMLMLLVFFFASNSVVIPTQNAIMKSRYRNGIRGSLFGWVMSAFSLFSLPAAMVVGALLDVDFNVYRILFIVEGVFGAGQALVLGYMAKGIKKFNTNNRVQEREKKFLQSLWKVFRKDKEFVKFETFFMLYGIGFMVVLPAIPFFAKDILMLDYGQYATARGVIAQVGMLLLSPFFGARVDKLHPFRFTGMVSLILAAYPLVIISGKWFPELGLVLFYLGYSFFSVGIAGINISWNMSSLYFAKEDQAATYQGLHISLVAVRGFFAPVLGTILLKFFGFTGPFLISTGCFTVAGLLFLNRYFKRKKLGLIDPDISPESV